MDILKLGKKIKKAEATAESYNTGLMHEKIIVASYKQMSIEHLEKIRIILNGIIKQKKEFKRIQESKQ